MRLLLGIDGGGTKTLAAVAELDGTVLATARAGASNYQSVGEEGAAASLREAIEGALSAAGASASDVARAAFGLAGYDGPVEAEIVRRVVVRAFGRADFVENDSLLILRAGTDDGVGVGLVAGTGNNCIGRSHDGRRLQIGGMGPLSGDAGSAPDLAVRAAAAAWRSSDGRAPRSALLEGVLRALEIERAERIVDRAVDGVRFEDGDVRRLVAALFEAEAAADPLARTTVAEAAAVLADNARAALDGLGLTGAARVVVLGGAVAERYPALSRAVAARLPEASVAVVPGPPVAGAILWAHDAARPDGSGRSAARARVLETVRVRA